VNGGDTATVKVGNDPEQSLNTVTNPVPDVTRKIEGTAWFDNNEDGVRDDDDELLEDVPVILYKKGEDGEYEKVTETVTDENGHYEFPDLEDGEYRVVFDRKEGTTEKADEPDGTNSIAEGHDDEDGYPENADITEIILPTDDEIIEMINNDELPDGEYVKDKQDGGFVANDPVPPVKEETSPDQGTGDLKAVNVEDEITYRITYKNYKGDPADIVINDRLDPNVTFVSTSNGGTNENGTVVWTIPQVAPGEEGYVILAVRVNPEARKSNGGTGAVVNGGDTATVKVGNDPEQSLNTVTNPVPDITRSIEGTAWLDKDEDGIRGDDDELLPNVPVILYRKGDDGEYEKIDETVTDKDGHYEFPDLEDGEYRVVFDRKEGTTIKADEPDGTNSIAEGHEDEEGYPENADITEITFPTDDEIISMYNDGELPDPHYTKEHQDGGFVENEPVPPTKEETAPDEGTGDLKAVNAGDEITYKITFKNYKGDPADIVIKDKLDPNVTFVSASNGGKNDNGTVVWTIPQVTPGTELFVTLTVKVNPEARKANGGTGSVVNGGDTATVKVGNDDEMTLDTVTNPVPDVTRTIEGTAWFDADEDGIRGDDDRFLPKVPILLYKKGDDGEYTKVDETVTDEDGHYEFTDLEDGEYRVVFDRKEGTTIKADEPDGTNSIAEGHNDEDGYPENADITEITLPTDKDIVDMINSGELPDGNYVKDKQDGGFVANDPEPPVKKETAPYEGTGELKAVNVGDEITYEITYKNHKGDPADIVIKDTLDKNVSFVSASDGGKNEDGVVTWTLKDVEPGFEGSVTLTVKVSKEARKGNDGPGFVVNGGDTSTVKVGDDPEMTLNTVTNPVPDLLRSIEGTAWFDGNGDGIRGPEDEVLPGITIDLYRKSDDGTFVKIAQTVTDENGFYIFEKLDGGEYRVVFERKQSTTVKADEPDGQNSIVEEKTDEEGFPEEAEITKITLPSDEEMLNLINSGELPDGAFKVENQDGGFVKNDPVPPVKKETAPFEGTGKLNAVKPGDEITYEIALRNYLPDPADAVVKDKLDPNVEFVKASDDGKLEDGVVVWNLKEVPGGEKKTVTVTVKVKEEALKSSNGPGLVRNGGEDSTVKIGNEDEMSLNIVENPVEEPEEPATPAGPVKRETAPYKGTGTLGAVRAGEKITYEISYLNYTEKTADVVIKDTLDPNVTFVEASAEGKAKDGVVAWTIENVPAGKGGTVTLTVQVTSKALKSQKGPGMVVNGGTGTSVTVGNEPEQYVGTVENPVPEVPVKTETAPYKGTGTLGSVSVGTEVSYEIEYFNYKPFAADIVIKDKLDEHVCFVKASDNGKLKDGVVTWTLKSVPAGKTGKVSLTVKVLESALSAKDGPGKVVNGGAGTTVQVGNDNAFTLNAVENPVPDPVTPSVPSTTGYSSTSGWSTTWSTGASSHPATGGTTTAPVRTGDETETDYYTLLLLLASGLMLALIAVQQKRKHNK
ncbi:MAG: DUF11 domain-containing protein, partial [Blautia sp.]|nr:DUF11 domain-containing protein [Blautia sp.]